jgi:hypothetical protein
MAYITREELKRLYPTVDYTIYSDATLDEILEFATEKVDDYCEQSFGVETLTDEISKAFIDSDNSLIIFPRKVPLISISAVSIVKGSAEVDITLTNGLNQNIYTIPSSADRIIFPIGDISLQSVSILDFGTLRNVDFYSKITYQAGYATIPPVIKEATALFALESITRNLNITGASSVSQGGISISYGSNGGSTKLSNEAQRLLAGFVKVTGW